MASSACTVGGASAAAGGSAAAPFQPRDAIRERNRLVVSLALPLTPRAGADASSATGADAPSEAPVVDGPVCVAAADGAAVGSDVLRSPSARVESAPAAARRTASGEAAIALFSPSNGSITCPSVGGALLFLVCREKRRPKDIAAVFSVATLSLTAGGATVGAAAGWRSVAGAAACTTTVLTGCPAAGAA